MKSKYFMPSFCLEELSVFPDDHMKMAYAVVCFADLLPEEIQNHMKRFHSNSYLRMSKEWAIKNNVSPVVYYTDNSNMANYLKHVIKYATEKYAQNELGHSLSHEELKFTNSIQMLLAYLKQYEGRYLIKNKKTFSDITNFYIEREWRYVPMPQTYEAFYLEEEDYYNEILIQDKQKELIERGYALRFNWTDIEEIGIPGSCEESFIDGLSNTWELSIEEIAKKTHFISGNKDCKNSILKKIINFANEIRNKI